MRIYFRLRPIAAFSSGEPIQYPYLAATLRTSGIAFRFWWSRRLIWIKPLGDFMKELVQARCSHNNHYNRERRAITQCVFGVSWYGHGVIRADGRPSGSAVAGLESFNRALKNIKEFDVGVAVKRDRRSRWYRAAD
jgi:hypothetical protein